MKGVAIILLLSVLGTIIVMYEITSTVRNRKKQITKQDRKN